MNAVSQILRILAIVGALAAGAMYYMTQTKVHDINAEMDRKVADLTSKVKTANDAADAAKQTSDKADADDKALTQQVADSQAKYNEVDGLRTQILHDLDEAQRQSRQKDATLSEQTAQIDDLTKKANSVSDLEAKVKTLTDQNAQLQTKIQNGDTGTPGPDGKKAGPVALGPPMPATVLQVDVKSGLLAIDAGSDKGLSNAANLVLQQDGVELARAIVADSHSSYAVLTITSTSGMSVGDFAKIVVKGLKLDYVMMK